MNLGFFIVLFILSFLLTFAVRRFALRYAIMDIPNERSSHAVPTPRGGGIALVIIWFIGITVLFFHKFISKDLYYALLSGVPLIIVGFLDDISNLRPSIRFFTQLLVAGLAIYFLGGEKVLDLGFFKVSRPWIFSLIALVGIVWFINIFNFLDGIDGYIGSEIIFLGAASYLLVSDQLGLVLAFVTMGFLVWNWQKAKIFMGDVGSTLLGFNIAVLALYHQNSDILSIPVWLILTSVFWMDATITLYRRIKNKEMLSKAHKKHAYQRIVQAGFSHQKTVIWAFVLNIIGFGFAWLALEYKAYSLVFLGVDIILLYFVMKWIDGKKHFEFNNRLK